MTFLIGVLIGMAVLVIIVIRITINILHDCIMLEMN
jgi:hypothetical protein